MNRATDLRLTRSQLLERLNQLGGQQRDEEVAHKLADEAILTYLADPEITAAFDAIKKWYA